MGKKFSRSEEIDLALKNFAADLHLLGATVVFRGKTATGGVLIEIVTTPVKDADTARKKG